MPVDAGEAAGADVGSGVVGGAAEVEAEAAAASRAVEEGGIEEEPDIEFGTAADTDIEAEAEAEVASEEGGCASCK